MPKSSPPRWTAAACGSAPRWPRASICRDPAGCWISPCGLGVYACALAARFPHLEAAVLEKPPVDRISRRAIAKRGFSSRVDVVAGDMLDEPLPAGYDVHLFSNVLHDWDEPVVERLVHASAEALAPGGLLIVHDAFLNARKDGPINIAGVLGAADARHAGTLLLGGRDGRMAGPRRIRRALTGSEWRGPERARGAPPILMRSVSGTRACCRRQPFIGRSRPRHRPGIPDE